MLKYLVRKAWGLKIVKEKDQILGAHGVLELEPQDRKVIFTDSPFLKFFFLFKLAENLRTICLCPSIDNIVVRRT